MRVKNLSSIDETLLSYENLAFVKICLYILSPTCCTRKSELCSNYTTMHFLSIQVSQSLDGEVKHVIISVNCSLSNHDGTMIQCSSVAVAFVSGTIFYG